MTLVFDSYAWIEFFTGSKLGEKVKEFIENGEEIVTPTIVLAEIANKYYREGLSKEIVMNRISVIKEVSFIREIDNDILEMLGEAREILTRNRRQLGLKRRPSLADIIVYATALVERARVVTGDEHFRGLDVIFLKPHS